MSWSHLISYCCKTQHTLAWLYKYHVPCLLDTRSLNIAISVLHISGWPVDLVRTSWQGMWNYLRIWITGRKQSKMSWEDLAASVCSSSNFKKGLYQGQNSWTNVLRFCRELEYVCILTYLPFKSTWHIMSCISICYWEYLLILIIGIAWYTVK